MDLSCYRVTCDNQVGAEQMWQSIYRKLTRIKSEGIEKEHGQESCTPIAEKYFFTFSSAVPVQLVPSIWQAFHEGMAWVAARIPSMTSALSAIARVSDDERPASIVDGEDCV